MSEGLRLSRKLYGRRMVGCHYLMKSISVQAEEIPRKREGGKRISMSSLGIQESSDERKEKSKISAGW